MKKELALNNNSSSSITSLMISFFAILLMLVLAYTSYIMVSSPEPNPIVDGHHKIHPIKTSDGKTYYEGKIKGIDCKISFNSRTVFCDWENSDRTKYFSKEAAYIKNPFGIKNITIWREKAYKQDCIFFKYPSGKSGRNVSKSCS